MSGDYLDMYLLCVLNMRINIDSINRKFKAIHILLCSSSIRKARVHNAINHWTF